MDVNDVAIAFWMIVLAGIVANLLWFVLTVVIAAAYVLRKDRSKFSGHWRTRIEWQPVWAEEMLLGDDETDPHSVGELALSYGSGPHRNQYWGLSFWRLKAGTADRAKLCVELQGIDLERRWTWRLPFFSHVMTQATLSSQIRKEYPGFTYPKNFASYRIVFDRTTEGRLEGSVVAFRRGEEVTVGRFTADRIA